MVIDDVLYGEDAAVATVMHDILGDDGLMELPFHALGFVADGRIVGGVYFFGHRPNADLEVCVAVKPGITLSKASIRQALTYPFKELSVPRLTAQIPAAKTAIIGQALRLGFRIEGTKRKGDGQGGDVIVLGLLPSESPDWAD